MSGPSSNLKAMCHYVILGVARTASEVEIRKAYKSLALQYHPDRNAGNEEAATEMFKRVQEAHDILTNPQERAWYDSNRDAILRGVRRAGEDLDEPDGIDLMPYFSTACFSGVTGETGFFTVYGGMFDDLAKLEEETDEIDEEEMEAQRKEMFAAMAQSPTSSDYGNQASQAHGGKKKNTRLDIDDIDGVDDGYSGSSNAMGDRGDIDDVDDVDDGYVSKGKGYAKSHINSIDDVDDDVGASKGKRVPPPSIDDVDDVDDSPTPKPSPTRSKPTATSSKTAESKAQQQDKGKKAPSLDNSDKEGTEKKNREDPSSGKGKKTTSLSKTGPGRYGFGYLKFGGPEESGQHVLAFYRDWLNFVSRRTFSWRDEYNATTSDHRSTRKAMELENKKKRQAARRDYNNLVRKVVGFVQRHDPRVARIREQERIQEEARKRVAEQKKKQQDAEKARRREQAKIEAAGLLEEQERRYQEMYGDIDDSDDDTGGRRRKGKGGKGGKTKGKDDEAKEGGNEEEEEQEGQAGKSKGKGKKNRKIGEEEEEEEVAVLKCEACKNTFKSQNQWLQHEQSAKHKQNVAKLQKQGKTGQGNDATKKAQHIAEVARKKREAELEADEVLRQAAREKEEREKVMTKGKTGLKGIRLLNEMAKRKAFMVEDDDDDAEVDDDEVEEDQDSVNEDEDGNEDEDMGDEEDVGESQHESKREVDLREDHDADDTDGLLEDMLAEELASISLNEGKGRGKGKVNDSDHKGIQGKQDNRPDEPVRKEAVRKGERHRDAGIDNVGSDDNNDDGPDDVDEGNQPTDKGGKKLNKKQLRRLAMKEEEAKRQAEDKKKSTELKPISGEGESHNDGDKNQGKEKGKEKEKAKEKDKEKGNPKASGVDKKDEEATKTQQDLMKLRKLQWKAAVSGANLSSKARRQLEEAKAQVRQKTRIEKGIAKTGDDDSGDDWYDEEATRSGKGNAKYNSKGKIKGGKGGK